MFLSAEDLPPGLKNALPIAAQELYVENYNRIINSLQGTRDAHEIAHKKAWAAVKKVYEKTATRWHKRMINNKEIP